MTPAHRVDTLTDFLIHYAKKSIANIGIFIRFLLLICFWWQKQFMSRSKVLFSRSLSKVIERYDFLSGERLCDHLKRAREVRAETEDQLALLIRKLGETGSVLILYQL